MKFLSLVALAVTAAATALPEGVPASVEEFRKKHPYKPPTPPTVPGTGCAPANPGPSGGPPGYLGGPGSPPPSPPRHVVTLRASANDTDDVAAAFEAGIRAANNGGTLYLPAGQTFMIGQPLDLTFLNDVQIHLDGEIKFTNDTAYWQKVAFRHPFQNSIMFWRFGGKNIKIYGTGTLNGNGQRWWNEFSGLEILDPTNAYLRPILFYAQNATDLSIEGIHFKDSPCWTNFIVTSTGISYKDIVVTAESNNATALPKNTDFFDSLNIKDLTVERAWVNIGDDCFSPKSNATGVHVNTMYCNGTHGQSMGSIGQYAGEKSIIEDVLIENVWLLNGQHGARLKSWAGPNVGYGYINNVTFRNFWNANNEYAAFLDSCYFNINATTCAAYPSQVNVTNVLFENFSGTTSGKYGRAVAKLTCSSNPNAVCENITFKNFTVTSPCGNSTTTNKAVIICDNIKGGLGTDCVPSNSTEAKAALADKCTAPMATLPQPTPW
ncbi:exo-polygalacturonase [Elsinoe ampelina]|uniref:galacturonan 1,4-alpha-galacturonidase n=1 Tax=Elsinoe ampelina TaxID=302913 RepID=A0A6A6GFZ5_9PEZI|nr:exo-polygalacturonase [Elsinoe ampelina]